ncbi:MAG: sigma-70 family RNA polymerase sigma factor, partial [Verrucomicrobia bacterium]|nr:sigma-70 family RNA polymerase sigma factor [Verrucomicrobiota bacterium]
GPDGGTGAAADDRAVEKLFAAVRRQALTRMRREGVAQRTAAADGDEAASSLTERVERLTPKQREVVWLKFSHGFGYEAVSGITGLSVHNVGFLLHSALTNLREAASAEGRVVAADDARVTDYVLEEMTADQRAAFDRALRRDDAATTALREVRALVMELHATFGNNEETSQRAKQKRRGAGAAWWRAKRVWGVAAGAVALGLGVWWYSQPERTPTKKATATEVFQMKPDVWKLAKARAEREEREARAKAGDGANARPGATDRTKDQPADERPTAETEKADRGETPAEPAKDGAEAARPEPAAGSPPVKENSPGKAERVRRTHRVACRTRARWGPRGRQRRRTVGAAWVIFQSRGAAGPKRRGCRARRGQGEVRPCRRRRVARVRWRRRNLPPRPRRSR